MSGLDTLRPEVADAVSALDETTCMTNPGLKWYATIRAELLRLTDENMRLSGRLCLVCGLHNDSQCPQRNDEMSPCTFDPSPVEAAKAFFARATKAEAELAALTKKCTCSKRSVSSPFGCRVCNPQLEIADLESKLATSEAELAALKARIAVAPIVDIANIGDPFIVLPDHLTVPNSMKGQRVRLVVEE